MSDVHEEIPGLDAFPRSVEGRRAGRIANVSPTLIRLLRGECRPARDYENVREHDLVPATGIALSVVMSGLIWVAIGCIIHFG